MAVIEFMTLPFLACMVLIGIHAYFGIHILRREIIFVDLALAQIAALGGMTAFFFHRHPNSWVGYSLSLVATFLGAGILAYTRQRQQKVPQEAYIGIVYAVATAAGILLSDKAPEGAEHVKEMLTGVILWVTGKTILVDAGIYLLVGLFHLVLFRKFWAISLNYEGARTEGLHVHFWDFLFYASFGIVVTLSVRVAGVLLVFCFLVIPAVISSLFWDGFLIRLFAAYVIGLIVTVLGLTASWIYDLPSGPAVAVLFALALVGAHIIRSLFAPSGEWTPERRRSAVTVGSLLACILFVLLAMQYKPSPSGEMAFSSSLSEHPERLKVANYNQEGLEGLVHHLLEAPEYEKDLLLEKILQKFPNPPAVLPKGIFPPPENPLNRYYAARVLLHWKHRQAPSILCGLLENTNLATLNARNKVVRFLSQLKGSDPFPYDPLTVNDEQAREGSKECQKLLSR